MFECMGPFKQEAQWASGQVGKTHSIDRYLRYLTSVRNRNNVSWTVHTI